MGRLGEGIGLQLLGSALALMAVPVLADGHGHKHDEGHGETEDFVHIIDAVPSLPEVRARLADELAVLVNGIGNIEHSQRSFNNGRLGPIQLTLHRYSTVEQ